MSACGPHHAISCKCPVATAGACVTHHACDCREAELAHLRQFRDAVEACVTRLRGPEPGWIVPWIEGLVAERDEYRAKWERAIGVAVRRGMAK